ncbi:MAG: hypothetical protein E4H05_08010 [Acidimicrobiales bacterium]|nr:MAG: hypothetical protein E4H05_08010 [Acidimicrobiales bacterium]
MNDVEQTLRQAGLDARLTAEAAIDVDADLAATLQRSTLPDTEERSAHSSRHTYLMFGVAAALVVVLIGGLLVIGGGDAAIDPVDPVSSASTPTQPSTIPETEPSTIAEQPIPPPATSATTVPGTTAPGTSTSPPAVSVSVPVSYRDPPPLYVPVPFATVERPSSVDGGYEVAVGDGIIVVTGNDTDITVLDIATGVTTRRQLAVAVGQPVFGPDNVLYGLSFTPPTGESQMPDAAIVAQPIGNDPIEIVDSVSVSANTYLELPLGTFVAGPDGIYDVDRARGKVMDYVGSAITNLPLPALIDRPPTEGTVVRSGDGSAEWVLPVEQHPNAANPFVGDRPAAPGPNGTTVVLRYIGPRLETEPADFGTATQPAIADLQPGTGRWWLLPDDWNLAQSSAQGTLLVRDVGNQLELAWFEPSPTG